MSTSPSSAEVAEAAQKNSYHPRGQSCVFVPLNEDWAIKLYSDSGSRDESYDTQGMLAGNGLAPQVGDLIDLPEDLEMTDQTESYRYGYITEIIKCCRDAIIEAAGGVKSGYKYGAECEMWNDASRKERHAANDAMKVFGFSNYDDWCANWGRNKQGKLMCLDFGD